LTLQPAFAGSDRQELLHQIALDEPYPPRRIDRNIPIELETIVLKAIAKNPTERYATAQELADDLQRFLDDKPVLAKRPSLLDKANKWTRRHRPVVVSAAALLLFTTVASLVASFRIAEEEAKTKKAYDSERHKAEEAAE